MKGYRLLFVKSVRKTKDAVQLSFEDAFIGFQLTSTEFLRRKLEGVKRGDVVAIKGRSGNSDAALARPEPIQDIRLYVLSGKKSVRKGRHALRPTPDSELPAARRKAKKDAKNL